MVQADPRPQSEDEQPRPDAAAETRAGEIAERPQLAPGVVLAGEMQDGAYEERQWLVQRDGQFVQLTELLYRVAEQIDGRRSIGEIARGVSGAIDRRVSEDNVRQLLSSKLVPQGLVARADGTVVQQSPDGQAASRSPLQINMRVRALSPRFINPFTAILQKLYWPPLLIAMLVVAGAAQLYALAIHGIAASVHDVLYHPALMFVVLGGIIVGTIWHEFGHASALRYGGGEVRGMGVGIYLVYPAFYTDVTDNYRLPRWSKVRTDLGGFYFNLIFAAGMVGLYLLTNVSWLLLIVLLIDLEIIQQILPFGRYDGYWTLADLTGIPDFFSRVPRFVRSLLPFGGTRDEEFARYKLWVRVVFALYVIVTVPVMAFIFFMMVKSAPRVLATGWDSAHAQLDALSRAQAHGDTLNMALAGVQLLVLALPTLGLVYILVNLARRGGRALWNYSKPTPGRRIKGSLIALGIAALLGYLWAPQLPFGAGRSGPLYSSASWQPIAASERGTLGDAGKTLGQVPVPLNPFHSTVPLVGKSLPGTGSTRSQTNPTATAHRTPAAHSTPAGQSTSSAQPTTGAAVAVTPTAAPTVTTPQPGVTPLSTSAAGAGQPVPPPPPSAATTIPTVAPTAVP